MTTVYYTSVRPMICLALVLIMTIAVFLHTVDAQQDCKIFQMHTSNQNKLPMPNGDFPYIGYNWRYVLEIRLPNNKNKYAWTSIDLTEPFCTYDNNNGKIKRGRCYNTASEVPEVFVNIENQIVLGGSFHHSMESNHDYVILLHIGWNESSSTSGDTDNKRCLVTALRNNSVPYLWKHIVEHNEQQINNTDLPWINNQNFPQHLQSLAMTRPLKWQIQGEVWNGSSWHNKTLDFPDQQQHNCFVKYDSKISNWKWGTCTFHPHNTSDNIINKDIMTVVENEWVQIKITNNDSKNIQNVKLILTVLNPTTNTTWGVVEWHKDIGNPPFTLDKPISNNNPQSLTIQKNNFITAEYLVKHLQMEPHPEGGFYASSFRSDQVLDTKQGNRPYYTSIYFLLRSHDISHLHRLKSDELWYYHTGSALTVHIIYEDGVYEAKKLGLNVEQGEQPQILVSKNTIFGSSVDDPNTFSLVGCMVSPGFDYQDFELFTQKELLADYPSLEEVILKMAYEKLD